MCACVDHLFPTLSKLLFSINNFYFFLWPSCTHTHRKLVARIDTDGDSLVDRSELVAWLSRVEDSYYQREINEEVKRADEDKDNYVTFQEYMKTFGFQGKEREREETVCLASFSGSHLKTRLVHFVVRHVTVTQPS